MNTLVQTPSSRRPGEFSRWLPLLLLWAAIVLGYFDTAHAMVTIWSRSDTFAHAYLVPPITAWLIWRQREALATIEARPNAWVLLPMGCVALVWLLGDLSASNAVAQFAFTALLVLAVPAVMGLQITRALMFPLGFLFFAVPFGEFLMPQLMEGTANFTVFALQLSSIPVYREGLHFIIPSGSWSVVEACSGVRYLIASVMVGTLFAYLNYHSTQRRLLFIAVSVVVPVVANWVRAYFIVMLGHLSNNRLATGVDHLVYGWVFFGIVIALMFFIGARWSQAPAALPRNTGSGAWVATPLLRLAPVLVAGFVLLGAPHLMLWNVSRLELAAAKPELALPAALNGGWAAQPPQQVEWKPAFNNPSAEAVRRYAIGYQAVGLYIGYYRNQNYGRKLVSSENVLIRSNDPVWAMVVSGTRRAKFGDGLVDVKSSTLRSVPQTDASFGGRMLVCQVYWVNGTLTSSDAWARLAGAMNRLMGRGDDGAVIVLFTGEGPDQGGPTRLQAFTQANFGLLDELLRATCDRKFELAKPGGGEPSAKF